MRSVRYILVNDRLDGELDQRLRLWHAGGVSYRAIARLLEIETGVKVSRESVRQWVAALDDENGAAA